MSADDPNRLSSPTHIKHSRPRGDEDNICDGNRRSEGAAHCPGCVDNNVFSLTPPDRAGPVRDRLVGYLFEKMRLNPEWEATIIGDGGRMTRRISVDDSNVGSPPGEFGGKIERSRCLTDAAL